MNFFKATVAPAAVTICCLGNDSPARAETDYSSFLRGYDYGFLYGSVSSSCLNYHYGYISRSRLLEQLRAINNQSKTTPDRDWETAQVRIQTTYTTSDN